MIRWVFGWKFSRTPTYWIDGSRNFSSKKKKKAITPAKKPQEPVVQDKDDDLWRVWQEVVLEEKTRELTEEKKIDLLLSHTPEYQAFDKEVEAALKKFDDAFYVISQFTTNLIEKDAKLPITAMNVAAYHDQRAKLFDEIEAKHIDKIEKVRKKIIEEREQGRKWEQEQLRNPFKTQPSLTDTKKTSQDDS